MDLENKVLACFDRYGLIIAGKDIEELKEDIRKVFRSEESNEWVKAINSWTDGEGYPK